MHTHIYRRLLWILYTYQSHELLPAARARRAHCSTELEEHDEAAEYSGEGSARTNDQSCEGQLHGDLGNLSQCSKEFDCKCQDARNNTYTCLRSLGQEDSVFCQFEDSTNFIEMYNLAQDKLQIVNLAKEISKKTIDFYKVKTTGLNL